MWPFRRTQSALADRLQKLEQIVADLRVDVAKVDLVALERVHGQVLNAIRSLRRLQEPKDSAELAPPPDPAQTALPLWAARRRA